MASTQPLTFLVNLKKDLDEKCLSIDRQIKLLSSSEFQFMFSGNGTGNGLRVGLTNPYQLKNMLEFDLLSEHVNFDSISHLIDLVKTKRLSDATASVIKNAQKHAYYVYTSLYVNYRPDIYESPDIYELTYTTSNYELDDRVDRDFQDVIKCITMVIHMDNLVQLLKDMLSFKTWLFREGAFRLKSMNGNDEEG